MNPLSKSLKDTGDLFFIGKARDLNAALYAMAERAHGRPENKEPFSIHPEVEKRMEKQS